MKTYDVIVVGAGAAGLMAAGQAAKSGAGVLLLDKNARVGRKLMITGKGRCNVTNDCDINGLITAVRRNPRFLYSAFDAFSPQDTIAFFASFGVALKVERGRRVFPQSDKASDIVDALARFVKSGRVEFLQKRVCEILLRGRCAAGVRTADSGEYFGRSVILCTGGLSYPRTGSTGDGYRMAEAAGHTVAPAAASIVPIVLEDKRYADLMGLSLKNVTLTLLYRHKAVFKELGEVMFTHFGLSGPLALSASSYFDDDFKQYDMAIDLKPALSAQQLDNRILRDFEQNQNKKIINSLDRLLPKRIIRYVIAQSEIPFDTKVNELEKARRAQLVNAIKNFAVKPASLRPVEEAVVTRGGVLTSQIDPKTMESKIIQGLFFAGEVLDLDAVTGGFNLQIAFSTGYTAGISAVPCNEK